MIQWLDLIIKIAAFIGALGVIIGSISKILDNKLKPLTNQNRIQFRHTIVAFANDIQSGTKKSRDEFNSVYDLIDEYENICKQLNIKNHLFESSLQIIDEAYKKLK